MRAAGYLAGDGMAMARQTCLRWSASTRR